MSGGEAGIGKTRLVRSSSSTPMLGLAGMLWGGCIGLGGFPTATDRFAEALRALVHDAWTTSAPRDAGRSARRRSCLGSSVARGPDPIPAVPIGAGADALHSRVSSTRSSACSIASPPMNLSFGWPKTLQWADPSTLDLLALPGPQRAVQPVQFWRVLTYRADELHRRHPLVPWPPCRWGDSRASPCDSRPRSARSWRDSRAGDRAPRRRALEPVICGRRSQSFGWCSAVHRRDACREREDPTRSRVPSTPLRPLARAGRIGSRRPREAILERCRSRRTPYRLLAMCRQPSSWTKPRSRRPRRGDRATTFSTTRRKLARHDRVPPPTDPP